MASEWTNSGPVSSPPRAVAYGAGVILLLLGLGAVGLGFKAGMRDGQPGAVGASALLAADGSTDEAKPIVVLPPPVTAPVAATTEAAKKDDQTDADKAKEAASQAAAAQQVQAKANKQGQDIDDILTSSSEKPPAPVKPSTDEAPPARSDVPY